MVATTPRCLGSAGPGVCSEGLRGKQRDYHELRMDVAPHSLPDPKGCASLDLLAGCAHLS